MKGNRMDKETKAVYNRLQARVAETMKHNVPREARSDNEGNNANNAQAANNGNGIPTRSLKDFITAHKDAIMSSLGKVMNVSFKGLSVPSLYKRICDRMVANKRRPKARQARLIAAAYEHLREHATLLVSSEMGTGKTQMAITLADLLNAKRIGIMCPVHLVSKWAAEIEAIYGKDKSSIRPHKIITIGCGEWASLDYYRDMRVKSGESLIFIFSYSAAKLGYKSRKVAVKKRVIRKIDKLNADGIKVPTKTICHTLVCPDCGESLVDADANESVIDASLDLVPRKCEKCGSILRQPAKGEKRLSLAEYAQRQLPKGWFDLLVADEIHELKGGDTGQGNAFGSLVARSKKVVGLTGTLLNGYAESVFYVLYRLNPRLMKEKLGLEYREVETFIDLYGAREKKWSCKDAEINFSEGVVTKKRGAPSVRNIPRINPLLLTQLLGTSIFLRLDEMNIALPHYQEIVERVKLDEAVKPAYNDYIETLLHIVKQRDATSFKKLGELATASLAILGVPDKERGDDVAFYAPSVTRNKAEAEKSGCAYLPITNKEQRLVEIVGRELALNRKCLVYITFSQLGTTEAVENALKKAMPNRVIRSLPDNVEPKRREIWLRSNPSDVLIVNPEKVKTGLDLLEYPTIIFFQPTYRTYTLKQAARRSWRIGQDKDVKVIFMVYAKTPEEKALQLIAKKLSTSSVIEGRIGEGLAEQVGGDDSIALALAKSLIKRERVEDFSMEEIVLGLRDNDPFERYYLDLCAKADAEAKAKIIEAESAKGKSDAIEANAETIEAINAIDKAQEASSNSLASLFETPLATAVNALKEQAVKEERVSSAIDAAGVSVSLSDANVSGDADANDAIDANRKIAIYRVVMKGKRKVEQKLEVTQLQLDELMAQEEVTANFQMAFDF
jgi:superfamily II DNA or RNA helicase